MNKKQKNVFIRILISTSLLILLHFLPEATPAWLRFALYLFPYLIIGHDILRKAWKGIRKKQVFDECFLMAVATLGAILLGDYAEGAAVMLFYQIGELFQSYAVGKSRRSISELMDIRPDYANVEADDGTLTRVDPDEVEIGTVITVRPGEKIPIDGVIVEGKTTLDTAALTGESLPRSAGIGDEVLSGCVNTSGVIRVRTTREFGESTVSKVLDLVENASSRKSRSEAFITRFSRVYTPAVCYGALALAVIPPVVQLILHQTPAWGDWLYRALTFLVISCPCALVISIPLSFFAGIGAASHAGVLVKGSNYLESLAGVRTIVFDKTGTLTHGVFEVSALHHTALGDEELLELAALAESHSSHPISASLKKACKTQPDMSRLGQVEEISGHGVLAVIDGQTVAVGNERLMNMQGVSCKPCHSAGTVVHIARGSEYLGHILISDLVKEHSAEAIRGLHKLGVDRAVMLTGDRKSAAEAIAQELGLDEVHSELLPADKVTHVEALLAQKPDKSVLAFVGDGINDAPVLTRADVGIAMGALGSDAAIEAADVVLMDDDPLKIVTAVQIARTCIRIVYENIWFAIGVKLICLLLGALGIANMWLAIFADVGVMILAVMNAIRILLMQKSYTR